MSIADEIINGTYGNKNKKKKKSIADSIINGTYEPTTLSIFNNEKEIAPVKTTKKEEEHWIKQILQTPEAFKDGYQFGDVTKTIGGTIADVGMGAVKGVVGIGESIGTGLASGVAQVADWVGKDEYADKVRNKIATQEAPLGKLLREGQEAVDKYSVSGDTGDMLSQGAGYLGGLWAGGVVGGALGKTAKATQLTRDAIMFGSSAGGTFKESYQKEGVEDWQAWAKAIGSGYLTAKIEKWGGVFGSGSLDTKAANVISSKIMSGAGKLAARMGVTGFSEMVEEFAEYVGNQGLDFVIDKVNSATSKNDATYLKEWDWDEVGQNMFAGFVLGSGAKGLQVAGDVSNNMKSNNMSLKEAINETARVEDTRGQLEALEDKKASLEEELGSKKLTQPEIDKIFTEMQQLDNQIESTKKSTTTDVNAQKIEDTNAQNITDKTYYHGTRGEFEAFDNSKIGQNYEGDWSSLGKGFYFTNDSDSAKKFGESSINEGEVTVKEAKLDIKKPFYVDDFAKNNKQTIDNIVAKYELGDIANGYNLIDALKKKGLDSTEVLKESGYDGIIAEDEVMVFDASQINTNKQKVEEVAQVQEAPMQETQKAEQTDTPDIKTKQLEIIQKTNPMQDDYHTGIRSVEDIKTFDETINDDESFVWGDFSQEDAKKALEKGTVTVYSSKPIEQGAFVSTSQNQARDYAGNGKIYSQEVNLSDVAWINGDEGQYAKVDTQTEVTQDTQTESVQTETPTQQEIDNLLDIQKNKSGSEYGLAFDELRKKYGYSNLYKALNEEYSRQKNGTKEVAKQVEEVIKPLQEKIENLTEQLDTVVNSIEEMQAPVRQDVVEKQRQDSMNSLMQEEAPLQSGLTEQEQLEKDTYDEHIEQNGIESLDEENRKRYEYLHGQNVEEINTDETKVKDPLEDRNIEEVGNRKVKAYQYENPEVRPYFQEEAKIMLQELSERQEGKRYPIIGTDGYTDHWAGQPRVLVEDIAQFKDEYKLKYSDIEKGLNNLIKDDGAENNAVSKRLEFLINDRLLKGYTTVEGYQIPPNQEYVNFLKEKQITEYSEEAYKEWQKSLDNVEPPTEAVEEIAPEPQKQVVEQPKTEVKEIAPSTEKVAQNENTKQPEIKKETQEEEKIAQILSESPTQENKKQRLWAKFRAGILDKGSVFEDLSIKNKNRELMSKWDYMQTAEARAQSVMINGHKEFDAATKTETKTSEGLIDIRTKVENAGLTEKFSELVYHRHNISRMSLEAKAQAKMQELQTTTLAEYDTEAIEKLSRKRITENTNEEMAELIEAAKEYVRLSEVKNKPVFGDSVTAEVSQEIVDRLENEYPELIDYANDLYQYLKADRQQLVDNGVISQETADLFEDMYPFYVPIGRANKNGNAINVPLDTNRTTINTPIKGAKGGNSDILPLFDTIAKRTLQTYRAVAKNSFGVELKNTLKSNAINETTNVDEVLDNVDQQESLLQEGKDGKAPTFTVFENGEKVTYDITQDMYEALKPVSDSSILSTTFKPFNKISNFHRGVLTEYNPVFMLTNAVKDAQDVLINSQHAAKTYAKFGEAYSQIAKKGYWYQEYMANGGEQNSYFDSQEGTFDTERKGIAKVLDTFPLKQISQLNNFIEMAPRLAEYIASRESGRSIETSMLDAARVTTNFKAGGDITKWANRNGATFLNASIQGAMQQVRNIREANANGLKGYANLALKFTMAGVPALLLNALLWNDDDEYEELSDYVKQNYYIVGKYGDGNFIRIPKGRMVSVIQESFNQMKHLITGDGEADLGQFLEIMGTNIAPNNPIENNVLAPIIGAINNKTWYGDDLVPTRLQDEPVKEQFDESTDKLSIFLGQTLGISPYKINYVLDQYSGGIGDVFLPMMTQQAETGTDNVGSKLIAPLTSKFTVDSVMKNQNVSDLYSKSEELTSKANSTSATDDDILKNKYLNSIKSEMNVLYKEKREIQSSSLSDSEKYEQVREIQEQINSMAKNAMNNYENINKTSNYATVGDKEYYLKNDTWTKVDKEELEELNSLDMDIKAKSTYFNLKSEISEINDSKAENKKSQIATAVKNTSLTDQQKAYVYGKNYSSDETLDLVINTGISFNEYLDYASQEFEADKNSEGKTISGSRKKKVYDYLNSMNIDYEQKLILAKMEYPAEDRYNYEIIDYLNSNSSIDYDTMESILLELGFKVDANGNINW